MSVPLSFTTSVPCLPDVYSTLKRSRLSSFRNKCSQCPPVTRASLDTFSFGEESHPNNPFSNDSFEFEPETEFESGTDNHDRVGGNGAFSLSVSSNGNGSVANKTAPQEDDEEVKSEAESTTEEHDEVFFDGLSYPPQALDWCVTHPAVEGQPVSENASIPSEGCSGHVCNTSSGLQYALVNSTFVETFRMSSPYINAHQGLIFVILIPGALMHENLFANVMEDIALMRVVGIKLVLVLGPQCLVTEQLAEYGVPTRFVRGIRVTDARTLKVVKEVAGSMRFEVECALAKGVTNMPSASRISVVGGNFFSAQPIGIIDGEDFGYTGKVRRIDVEAIRKRLDQGDIIVLPNVGSSPSGQQFNCKAEEVAAECAAQLKAEKLIFLGRGETLYDRRCGHTIPNLSLSSASRYLQMYPDTLPDELRISLQYSVLALDRGVRRAHILNRYMNGVLLMEVFHRDGVGLMVSRDLYEGFRPAKSKDVNGVKAIIRPLEEQGILKERSRTMLERDIEKFVVIERDGMIIACLSLTVMEDDATWAELGCVAVHKNYRKLGKGDAMLGYTERMAYEKGVRNLFILSTQSFDWFRERGFMEVTVEDLPLGRQEMYDRTRRSKIFYKVLQGSRAVDEAEVLKHL